MPAIHFADVINAADVFVSYLSRDAHFTMKPGKRGTVAQKMIGQKLESYRLAQLQIVGTIHLTHTAFTEETNDSISIDENCARNEAGVIDGVERLRLGVGAR